MSLPPKTEPLKYKNRIHLTRPDALAFIKDISANLPTSTFICIDPPYFNKGQGLYISYYDPEDHRILAKSILELEDPWIVTYDNVPAITSLYRDRRQYQFDISYSVETKRRGTGLLIASKGLRLLPEIRGHQVSRPQYRAA